MDSHLNWYEIKHIVVPLSAFYFCQVLTISLPSDHNSAHKTPHKVAVLWDDYVHVYKRKAKSVLSFTVASLVDGLYCTIRYA